MKVSQSPNLKALLERTWHNIVAKHRPDFQDAEDAHTLRALCSQVEMDNHIHKLNRTCKLISCESRE